MELFEQWKKESIRWEEECKKNRHQKEEWEKISKELLSDDVLAAFRKLRDKGWTHALTEFFDVGTDNMIRWKRRPAPNLDIQISFHHALNTLPSGHILQILAEKEGLQALWMLRLETEAPQVLSKIDAERLESISLQMRKFPKGNYSIGSNDLDSWAYPVHEVALESFSLGVFPVTQYLYYSVLDHNPSSFSGSSRPVEMVSWFDALRFCNVLSQKKGLQACYQIAESSFDGDGFETTAVEWNRSANGYRLPTEEEWEMAARFHNEFEFAGAANATEVGWFRENSMMVSHAIMQKKLSPSGLYDLNGNVDEWCWSEAVPYEGADVFVPSLREEPLIRPPLTEEALVIENERRAMLGIPPLFTAHKEEQSLVEIEKNVLEKVCRGGGWFDIADGNTIMRRSRFYPTVRDGNIGFRLAKNA